MRLFDRSRAAPGAPDHREGLRTAQRTARTAEAAAAAAAQIAEAARAAMDRARAAVALHDGLEQRITEWRADLFRRGDIRPDIALPDDLAAGRQAVESAKTEWLSAEGVYAVLAAEAVTAAGKAAAADAAVLAASDAVVEVEVLGIVNAAHELELEAGRLRGLVAAFCATRSISAPALPGAITLFGFEPVNHLLIENTQPNFRAPAETWIAFRAALAADPDARFNP